MKDESRASEESLPLSAAERIDQTCDRFEDAWAAVAVGGREPRLEDFLGDEPGPERADLFRNLLRLELHYRRQLGDTPTADEYRGRFTDQAEVIRAIFQEVSASPELSSPAPPRARETLRMPRAQETALDLDRTRPPLSQVPSEGSTPCPPGPLPSVPDYEVLGELGRGGMGVVYMARHVPFDRLVALKMILPRYHISEDALARFVVEARSAARLKHPHIVPVYDIGEQDGLPYLSMEYVEGGSLDKKLAGAPQPPRAAAELVEKLARAMHHAHEQQVVHRDLKPANVLLTADGTPKVTDFGLAKQLDTDQHRTDTGAIVGTPSYMAPEQAAGRAKDLGPPVDVYALGATLYELLTGQPPFKAPTHLETLEQVRTREPVPPGRLRSGCPADLQTICLKCLEKEPRRRYASAQELADDLRRFLEYEPIRARRVNRAERLWRWCKRKPAVAALTAVAASLVIVAGVLGSVNYQLAKQAGIEKQKRDELANQAKNLEKKASHLEEQNGHLEKEVAEKSRPITHVDRQVMTREQAERMTQQYQIRPVEGAWTGTAGRSFGIPGSLRGRVPTFPYMGPDPRSSIGRPNIRDYLPPGVRLGSSSFDPWSHAPAYYEMIPVHNFDPWNRLTMTYQLVPTSGADSYSVEIMDPILPPKTPKDR